MRRKIEDGLELRLGGGQTRDATGDFIQRHFYLFFSAPQNILVHSNEIQLYLYSIMPSSSFSSSFALFWEKLWQRRILLLPPPHPPTLFSRTLVMLRSVFLSNLAPLLQLNKETDASAQSAGAPKKRAHLHLTDDAIQSVLSQR